MAAVKLDHKLTTLLSKNSIDDGDVLAYIKSLAHLSKTIKSANRFQTYAPLIKKWIGAYETIFTKSKVDAKGLKYINKTGGLMTELFFTFMPTFNQVDPDYNQEFYVHWKRIISRIKGYKRAQIFIRNIKRFKTLVENMRTAKQRCEQLAILEVLRVYIERVPSKEVAKLKECYNTDVIDKLIQMNLLPTVMNRHAFLHDINALGRSIISLKPTKIICDELSMNYNTSSHSLWIDFNLRDNSIIFVTVPLTSNFVSCIAVVTAPKLKEKLFEAHVMKIRGTWSILTNGDPFRKKSSVTVILPIHDRNAIWKARVKSIFSFVPDTTQFSQSFSQAGNPSESEVTDYRIKHAVNDSLVASQRNESGASSSISCFGNDTSLTKFLESSISPQIRQRANEQPVLDTSMLQESHQNQIKSNSAEPNYSVGDGKQDVYFDDSIVVDGSLTEVIKKSINPIANKQLDNDNEQQCLSHNADESNDLKEANQLNELTPKPANDKHSNENVDVSDISIALHLPEDCSHSSGISFCNDMSVVGEGSDDDGNENDKHKTENHFQNNSNEKHSVAEEKKNQVVETMTREDHRSKSLDSKVSNVFQKTSETASSQISVESFSSIEARSINEVVNQFLQENDSDVEMRETQTKVINTYRQLNDSLRAIIGSTSPARPSQKQNKSNHSVVQSTSPKQRSQKTSLHKNFSQKQPENFVRRSQSSYSQNQPKNLFRRRQSRYSQNQPEIIARRNQASPMLSPVRKNCETTNENQERFGQLNESTKALKVAAKSPIRNLSQKQGDKSIHPKYATRDNLFEKISSENKKPPKIQILNVDIIVEPRDESIKSPNDSPSPQIDVEMSVKPTILVSQEPYSSSTVCGDINKKMDQVFQTDSHSSESVDVNVTKYDEDSDLLSSKPSITRTTRGAPKRTNRNVCSLDDSKTSSPSGVVFSKSSPKLKKRKMLSLNESARNEKPLKKQNVALNSRQKNNTEFLQNESNADISIKNPSHSGVPKKLPIPPIVNMEENDPTINDNPPVDDVSEDLEEQAALDGKWKNENRYQIKKCNDVKCCIIPLANKLHDLMKNNEVCELHRGLFMKFIENLQNDQQPRSNSTNRAYVEVMKPTLIAIKSICQKATLDVVRLINGTPKSNAANI